MNYRKNYIAWLILSVFIHIIVLSVPVSIISNAVRGQESLKINFYTLVPVKKGVITQQLPVKGKRSKIHEGLIQREEIKKPEKEKNTIATKKNEKEYKKVEKKWERKKEMPVDSDNQLVMESKKESIAESTKRGSETTDTAEKVNYNNAIILSDQSDKEQGWLSEDLKEKSESLPGKIHPYRGPFGIREGPRFLKQVLPTYPSFARRRGIEGKVVLCLKIDEKGVLQGVEVVENAGFGFTDSAIRAVRESSFLPAMRDGVPVPAEALLTVRFRLR